MARAERVTTSATPDVPPVVAAAEPAGEPHAPAGDADIVEAVAVEVAPQQCESTSPYEGGERCAKESGHTGHHRNHGKESW